MSPNLFAVDWASNGPWYAAAGAAVLCLLVALRLLGGRTPPADVRADDLAIHLAELPQGLPGQGRQVHLYGVPVRIAAAVVAPAGRNPMLSNAISRKVLSHLLPQMEAVLQDHGTRVISWPGQLSVAGFQTSFFHHGALPGDHGRDTPWCSLCGRLTCGDRHFLIGLICCSDTPNTLGQTAVDHEAKWLDVLRVS